MTIRVLKYFVFILTFIALAAPVAVQAHGGGCRKNSPPGQCCHMETRTGRVHCH